MINPPGAELAKKIYRYYADSMKEDADSIRMDNPIAQARFAHLLPHESLLAYCLVESGLAMDAAANPYLKDQPETAIRFELVRNTGL
ncbi:MAG: hypothetical protein WBC70_09465 [Candidatus Aminicenantales bacterium]